jgi:hypothetical protein
MAIPASDWRNDLARTLWKVADQCAESQRRSGSRIGEGVPPGQAVHPSLFCGRWSQLASIDAALRDSINGHPDRIAVIGPIGVGKSSFLRKIEERARDSGCLVLRREIRPDFHSVESLADSILRACVDELKRLLPRTTNTLRWFSTFWAEHDISISVPGMGGGSIRRRDSVDTFRDETFFRELKRFAGKRIATAFAPWSCSSMRATILLEFPEPGPFSAPCATFWSKSGRGISRSSRSGRTFTGRTEDPPNSPADFSTFWSCIRWISEKRER